jgi:hypothetical protein
METEKAHPTYDEIAAALPSLETEEQIDLLEVLTIALKKSVRKKKRKHSLMELEGLGAEVWSGVNVEQFLRSERDSWN